MAKTVKFAASKRMKHGAPGATSFPKQGQVHFGKHKSFGRIGKDGVFFSWVGGIGIHILLARQVPVSASFGADILQAFTIHGQIG